VSAHFLSLHQFENSIADPGLTVNTFLIPVDLQRVSDLAVLQPKQLATTNGILAPGSKSVTIVERRMPTNLAENIALKIGATFTMLWRHTVIARHFFFLHPTTDTSIAEARSEVNKKKFVNEFSRIYCFGR